MSDVFHPSVDLAFITAQAQASGLLAPGGIVKIGAMTTFVEAGNKAIWKRSTSVRELEAGQICFEQATAIAIRLNFLGPLLDWLLENRNWKEGAYIVVAP